MRLVLAWQTIDSDGLKSIAGPKANGSDTPGSTCSIESEILLMGKLAQTPHVQGFLYCMLSV